MAGGHGNERLGWPWWQQALLAAVLAVLASVRLFGLAEDAAYRAGLLGEPTSLGGTYDYKYHEDTAMRGEITSVDPGGPLDNAGIRVGDRVRADPLLAAAIRWKAGQQIPMEIERNGGSSSAIVTVAAVPPDTAHLYVSPWLALNRLAALVTTLFGCFILWRGWGKPNAMLLGAGLLPLHVVGLLIPNLFAGHAASILYFGLSQLTVWLSYLLLLFAMRQYHETAAPLPRWAWVGAIGFIAFRLVGSLVRTAQFWFEYPLPFWALAPQIANPLILFVFGLSITVLVVAWRRSSGEARNRNAAILLALLAYLLGAFSGFAGLASGSVIASTAASASLAVFNALFAGLFAPSLLAYAILRHKLFDIGFAVNRTLVYGAISGGLLVGIGLTEYAVKKLVPAVWTEGSVFISAGIALGVFLLFHRIHHNVEHFIERLFFHQWQVNEAKLKRFVAAAAHIEKPEALKAQFADELARFSGGAAAVIWQRARDVYADSAGGTIDADEPALAAMRAEQGSVVPGEVGSALDAALALPMMHQAALAGFVLLAPKPGGEDYRPDEVEVLGWAVQQVGLDLQAIRVRALEQEVLTLGARNAELADVLAQAARPAA